MDSKSRRNYIEQALIKSKEPFKGQNLAKELGVTRQIIVKDIAILRAEGKKIIATPDGYMIPKKQSSNVRQIVALCHDVDDIKDELECIVKYGGIIEDVVVEHPVYGEIKAMLMIKTMYDIQNFVKRIREYKAEPLLVLTGGIHLHTIQTEEEESMKKIIKELKDKNYLISDEE